MSKAILILDKMPSGCDECPLHNYHFCDVNGDPIDEDIRPSHCLLKEAPEHQLEWYDDESSNWERGYNACLDEILG
jgi:hypothetical protein